MVWKSIGPTTQLNLRNAVITDSGGDFVGNVSGRTEALAYSPNINAERGGSIVRALFNGSSSGGVWRTTSVIPETEEIADQPVWVLVSPPIDSVIDLSGAVVNVLRQV